MRQHCRRAFGSSRETYVDKWFASIVKSQSFYEELANAEPIRCYFYNVDLHGRLFIEDVLPKNMATSIKDARFLDFFFSRIRTLNDKDRLVMTALGISDREYPFVSPCGGLELNFIRPAATPLVFHTMMTHNTRHLLFAGSLEHCFHPDHIRVSRSSGRLYHQVTCPITLKRLQNGKSHPESVFGLIRSNVAVLLSDSITTIDDILGEDVSDLVYHDGNEHPIPIRYLPPAAEPGPWALPL